MSTCLLDEREISNEFHVDIGLSKEDTGGVLLNISHNVTV